MENTGNRQQVTVLTDWHVKVSQDLAITGILPMKFDPARTRLLPSYLETGEMSIIVPAVSHEAAEEKAKSIAREIASVGLWGTDIWDTASFLASIERLL